MNRCIPITSLPQTMRDSITVARSLSIEYIWIDSLCIIQDDPDDMQRQLVDMPRIYQDAVLTIFASAAQNAQEGFLHDHGYDYTFNKPFSLPYRSSDGSSGKLILLEVEEYIDWRVDYLEPIDTRLDLPGTEALNKMLDFCSQTSQMGLPHVRTNRWWCRPHDKMGKPSIKSDIFSSSKRFTKSEIFSSSDQSTKSEIFPSSEQSTKSTVFSRCNYSPKFQVFSRCNLIRGKGVESMGRAASEVLHTGAQ